jgi:DNA-directed RNA polymerase subunit RPC12/RpoP
MLSPDLFLKKITQRHLPKGHGPACPVCGKEGRHLAATALSGALPWKPGAAGDGGDDDGHLWEGYTCQECGLRFVRESKDGNVWYTPRAGRDVLAGLPNCALDYRYTCADCGGPVVRSYTLPDGHTPAPRREWAPRGGLYVPLWRTFFACRGSCGWRAEVDFDYLQAPPTRWEALRAWLVRLWRWTRPPPGCRWWPHRC